ncbi:MAG: TIGR02206 family membrane protein [Lachnospiraceae bacterium]|jgi:hypothetical integral membrane protein (TIGR02206 family)|nr:TIGR02206 family membrane protein [Lachnospiraceae bacterium]
MIERSHWFFSHQLPVEQRFASFSLPHLYYIIAGIVVVIVLSIIIKRLSREQAMRFIRVGAIGLLAFYFIRSYLFYLLLPNYTYLDIVPLHLCVISGFVIPLAVFSRNKLLLNISYAILMPGAMMAIITPDRPLTLYHPFGWMPLVYFLWHFWVVALPVLLVVSGELVPDIRKYPLSILSLCGYATFVYLFNTKMNTNYLFINRPARGTLLEPLNEIFGNPGYLIPLALITFTVILLMFIPWWIKAKKAKVQL